MVAVARVWTVAVLGMALLAAAAAGAADYKPGSGPYRVRTTDYEWRDTARNRIVPVRIHAPDDPGHLFPVVVFSHGLGGSRAAGAAWGAHWASHGYVAVHLQHAGSDEALWKDSPDAGAGEAMRALKGGINARNTIARLKDVSFALDRLEALDRSDPAWRHRLDLARVGLAGHSYGAETALGATGKRYGPRELALADRRIRAAIAMSPPGGPVDAFGAIRVPVMVLTGTLDDSPAWLTPTRAAERRAVFDGLPARDKFLVVFDGGDHMVFSGQPRRRGDASADAFIHRQIRMATVAFWDAYLRDDAAAREWLAQEWRAALGAGGALEQK
jgi:predicted dienelactone hydrolase